MENRIKEITEQINSLENIMGNISSPQDLLSSNKILNTFTDDLMSITNDLINNLPEKDRKDAEKEMESTKQQIFEALSNLDK
jgi:hypothetical protein